MTTQTAEQTIQQARAETWRAAAALIREHRAGAVSIVGDGSAFAIELWHLAKDFDGRADAAEQIAVVAQKPFTPMPPCATCGHAWGEHARPPHIDADIDQGERWCYALTETGECRCRQWIAKVAS